MIDKNILIKKLDSIIIIYNKKSIVTKAIKLKDKLERLKEVEETEIIFTWREDAEIWERSLKHINSLLKYNLITKEEAKEHLKANIIENIESFFKKEGRQWII